MMATLSSLATTFGAANDDKIVILKLTVFSALPPSAEVLILIWNVSDVLWNIAGVI